MIKINEEEMICYKGGSYGITASFVSALTKAVSVLYQIGQNLGSTIRRYINNSSC